MQICGCFEISPPLCIGWVGNIMTPHLTLLVECFIFDSTCEGIFRVTKKNLPAAILHPVVSLWVYSDS